MYVYIFADGKKFFADSAADLVEQLRAQSYNHTEEDTNEDYMEGFAKRSYALLDILLSVNDEESFVKSLEENGLLSIGYAN